MKIVFRGGGEEVVSVKGQLLLDSVVVRVVVSERHRDVEEGRKPGLFRLLLVFGKIADLVSELRTASSGVRLACFVTHV